MLNRRSLEESKLFERALIATIADEDARALQLAALESALSGEEDQSQSAGYISQVGAIVTILAVPVAAPEAVADDQEEPTSRPPTASSQESRRTLPVPDKKSSEAQAKVEQEHESARRHETQALLDAFWSRTCRHTKVRVF